MPQLFVPSWLQPADPAAQFARGFPMGSQVGEAQAMLQQRQEDAARQAQQFAMEQEFQKQQLAARTQAQQQQQALEEKYYTVAAKTAADKAAAIMGYQQAVQGGMDPTKALFQYGPAMGQGTAEAAALRSQYQMEALKQKQEHDAEVLRVKQEMQDKLLEAKKQQSTPEDREAIRSDRKILGEFEKNYGGMMGKAMRKSDPEGYDAALAEARAAAADILESRPNDPMAMRYAGQGQSAPDTTLDYIRGPNGALIPNPAKRGAAAPAPSPTLPRPAPVTAPATPIAPYPNVFPPVPRPPRPIGPAWPQQEQSSVVPPTLPAGPGRLQRAASGIMRTSVGKAVADALEGMAGLQDLANLSGTDYTDLVKSLRKTFEDAVPTETASVYPAE